jgi:hypothetical protein
MGCVCISPTFCLDDSNQEGNQTINDEQTGFSGSTGSYSDILASNPNSRPATAAQSRPASSTKLSRPSSALARPTSAVKQEEKDDKTDKVAVDINSKSNNDAIDVAVKAGSKIDQIKISKTDDSIEEKREVVKLPEKAVVKDVEVKSLEIERNGAEVKDKEVKALKNDRRPSGAKVEEKKQPVPKAGKNVNERKTVGKQVTPGRGVPPKLPKSEKKAAEKDTSSKAGLNKTVLEGEGLLENISEPVSKLDPVSGDGHMEVDGDLAKVMKGHDNTGTLLIGFLSIKKLKILSRSSEPKKSFHFTVSIYNTIFEIKTFTFEENACLQFTLIKTNEHLHVFLIKYCCFCMFQNIKVGDGGISFCHYVVN